MGAGSDNGMLSMLSDKVQFSSLAEFLAMGGYAFNVWSVYALFLLFVGANLYYPLLHKHRIIREQRRRKGQSESVKGMRVMRIIGDKRKP